MKRSTKLIKIICVFFAFFVTTISLTQDSYADVNALYKKNLLNNLVNCYNRNYFYAGPIVVGSNKSDKEFKDLEYDNFYDSMLVGNSDEMAYLPTGIMNTFNAEQKITCKQLFDGDASMIFTTSGEATGLFDAVGVTPATSYSNTQEKESFVKRMGYSNVNEAKSSSSEKHCFSFNYEVKSQVQTGDKNYGSLISGPIDAGKVCWNLPTDTKITKYNITENAEITQPTTGGWNDPNGTHYGMKILWASSANDSDGGALISHCLTDSSLENYGDEYDECAVIFQSYVGISDNYTQTPTQNGGFDGEDYYIELNTPNAITESGKSYSIKQFSIKDNNFNSACIEARNNIFGDSGSGSRNSMKCNNEEVTDQEKKELYDYYLSNVYHIEVDPFAQDCQNTKPSSGYFIMALQNGKKAWCPIGAGSNSYKKVTAYTDGEKYILNTTVDLEGLLKLYNNLELDVEDLEEIEKIEAGIEKKEYDDKVDAAASMDPCFSKANSLGWILCPVIEFLSDTTENLYSWIEDDFMVVETNFFARTESSSVYSVWSSFVGFANTLLVIFLMIIVFSQLTGIGIDNYGIKKTLPKIIIAAILINLSYIICELAVDLSNILGRGLNDWFTAMGQGVPLVNVEDLDGISQGTVGTHSGLFNVLKVAISGGVITSGVIAIVETVSGGGFVAILLPLLIALVVAVVAIFFFFVLLGLRKAGVIMLVAISPLAFICYTLPNTKPLFKKWLKALEGLLILYPICGLMIGGGYYVSRVILSISSDYFMRFVAFMLTVVPFFFIPKLLVGSFAAMGNIGAKISGISKSFGKRTSTRLDKGIRNSERFKDTQERHAGERANRIAARLKKRSETGDLSARDQRRLVRYNKQANEWNAANDSGHLSAILAAQEQAVGEQRVKDEEALIRSGAGGINANSPESLESGYKAAIDALDANPTDASMLAKVKAFQNVMSKTDKGRASMQKVLEQAVKDGKDSAAYSAASHLSSEHMGDIKNVNRGMFGMLNDIASGEGGDKLNLSGVRSNIGSKKYDIAGANKYTAKTLSSADEETLNRLANGISYMSNNERNSISQTANTALSNPNIVADLKPEVVENLRKLANCGVGGTSGRMGPHGSADMDESGF